MHGTARARAEGKPAANGVNAVVWIEPGRAIIVRGTGDDDAQTTELPIPHVAAMTPPALAEVAHAIGEVDHVLVLGADELRTALEREIVAIGHRPETIRDVAAVGPMDVAVLRERLARLG